MVITEAQKFWLESDFVLELLKQIPAHVFWKDRDSVYLGCNNVFAYSLGLSSPEEIIGKTDYDLPTTKEESDSFRADDKQVIESKKPKLNIEECQTLPDGRKITLLTNKVPLLDKQNNVIGILGIYYDITERKNAEKALAEAINAKGIFMSIVSHEINGPLANVLYILNILEQDIKNEMLDKKAALDLISKEKKDASRGIDTIKNLQKFLKLDLETEEMSRKKSVNLRSEILKLIDDFENDTIKNIEFNIIDNDAPKSITINPNIFKAIDVAISNAFKYSNKNSKILVQIKRKDKEGANHLEFLVKDSGIGIKKEVLKKLFNPLMSSGKDKEEIVFTAPAIKLSYAKKTAELLGGNLKIKSEEGEGVEVLITVPYEYADPIHPSLSVMDYAQPPEANASQRILKILSVEDNMMTSELLCGILKSIKQDVLAVHNSDDALKIGKKTTFDVIFMDISIPGMDGVELMKKLKNPDPEVDKPIFIAITSHGGDEDFDYFIEQGFTSVIVKPFTREVIISCVETIQKVLNDLGYP